jgi:beta-alanine degradation protein BauB
MKRTIAKPSTTIGTGTPRMSPIPGGFINICREYVRALCSDAQRGTYSRLTFVTDVILERMSHDPTITNPDFYRVAMENDRVRVLEYIDRPGDRTTPHVHPDSVMITMSSFRRRLIGQEREVEVELEAGQIRWLGAQEHAGENIGDTETHVFFVELKQPRSDDKTAEVVLGPTQG